MRLMKVIRPWKRRLKINQGQLTFFSYLNRCAVQRTDEKGGLTGAGVERLVLLGEVPAPNQGSVPEKSVFSNQAIFLSKPLTSR